MIGISSFSSWWLYLCFLLTPKNGHRDVSAPAPAAAFCTAARTSLLMQVLESCSRKSKSAGPPSGAAGRAWARSRAAQLERGASWPPSTIPMCSMSSCTPTRSLHGRFCTFGIAPFYSEHALLTTQYFLTKSSEQTRPAVHLKCCRDEEPAAVCKSEGFCKHLYFVFLRVHVFQPLSDLVGVTVNNAYRCLQVQEGACTTSETQYRPTRNHKTTLSNSWASPFCDDCTQRGARHDLARLQSPAAHGEDAPKKHTACTR